MVNFAAKLRESGVECAEVGVGSTPTCSLAPAHLEGVTEMHPGNYFYYDAMQASVGSCKEEDIAVQARKALVTSIARTHLMR